MLADRSNQQIEMIDTENIKVNSIKLLQNMPYYHGLCPRSEIMPLFKNKGDFLIRSVNILDDIDILLSVCLSSKKVDKKYPHVTHLSIIWNSKELTWELGLFNNRKNNDNISKKKFKNIVDFVIYYGVSLSLTILQFVEVLIVADYRNIQSLRK